MVTCCGAVGTFLTLRPVQKNRVQQIELLHPSTDGCRESCVEFPEPDNSRLFNWPNILWQLIMDLQLQK